jgi:threonine dehydrogenase-like Zn-dependent dehydrogenase
MSNQKQPDKYQKFRQADAPLPSTYQLWPLYGAGFENLGRHGQMIDVTLPEPGPDELLVRHDAVGICFSDIKVIKAGQNHPRVRKNMQKTPVVLGHEVALTVVKAGENLRQQYAPGDRFIVQADIYINGLTFAYGYEIQGGFSEYNIIDQRVLNGDHGNYLIPIKPTTGYAEAALNEPWACVQASYQVAYRSTWKAGGSVYFTGDGAGIRLGAAQEWRPGKIVLNVSDQTFAETVSAWAAAHNIVVSYEDDGQSQYDDIVLMSNDAAAIEQAFTRLAKGGIFNLVSAQPVSRNVMLDIGRLHYDGLQLVGTAQDDLAIAYAPVRTELKKSGTMWALGAAGPMGQMHVQRAIELPDGPRKVVATNIHPPRMHVLAKQMAPIARQHGVDLVCLSEQEFDSAAEMLQRLRQETNGVGFDDVVVIAANAATAEMAMALMSEGSVMNIFAGLPRGTLSAFDVNLVTHKNVRFTGISGSSIDDLRHMLDLTESHRLSTNHSVAAVAGLEGVPDGLQAVSQGRFPGKVVIYPHIKHLPLTPLADLQERLPSVHAKLDSDGAWTNEAEMEMLRLLL